MDRLSNSEENLCKCARADNHAGHGEALQAHCGLTLWGRTRTKGKSEVKRAALS